MAPLSASASRVSMQIAPTKTTFRQETEAGLNKRNKIPTENMYECPSTHPEDPIALSNDLIYIEQIKADRRLLILADIQNISKVSEDGGKCARHQSRYPVCENLNTLPIR